MADVGSDCDCCDCQNADYRALHSKQSRMNNSFDAAKFVILSYNTQKSTVLMF